MQIFTQAKNQEIPQLRDTIFYRGNTFFDASPCECCNKILIEEANQITIVTKFNDIDFYQRDKIDAVGMSITDQYTFNDDGQLICLNCENK